ncbi:protein-tyrosine phosphatase-like protein [Chytridium lagenaria]|nr:protein-tyrosine phosphatase-like protein [Chytridium lagenaria]
MPASPAPSIPSTHPLDPSFRLKSQHHPQALRSSPKTNPDNPPFPRFRSTLTPPAEAKPAKEPLDWLDRLGVEKLPMGRAPSASGFVGGFRVAASYLEKTAQQQQKAESVRSYGGWEYGEHRDSRCKTDNVDLHGCTVAGCAAREFCIEFVSGEKGAIRYRAGEWEGYDQSRPFFLILDVFLHWGSSLLYGKDTVFDFCCLNNAEMSYLGAPWAKYSEAAQKYGMDIVRIPIIEGSCPESMESLESVLTEIENRIGNGVNVLCHCRGGIGRAGLVACCYLIRRGYVVSAERAIQFVRVRRSPKAIETQVQEDFIQQYFDWVVSRRANGENVGPTL